jgi:hypothetical protein
MFEPMSTSDTQQLSRAAQQTAPRARRRDARTSRIVYRALTLRRAFGKRAARLFLLGCKLPPALVERVLSVNEDRLRR